MKIAKTFTVVDAHTTGTPIRVITGGIPRLRGDTMSQKMWDMEQRFDWMRSCIACQPRGFQSLVCAVLTQPCSKEADYGVFYLDAKSYQPMCGAGTLSVAKVLVETGMVEKTEPVTEIVLETPAGIVRTSVEIQNGEVQRISLENTPAFLCGQNVQLHVPELGDLTVDIGFGGNFFVLVNTAQLPLPLNRENRSHFKTYMRQILRAADAQIHVQHPLNPELTTLDQVLFYNDTLDENGGYTCQCVFGDAQLDISPCGTGTCTRLAQMYTWKRVGLQEQFIQNSIWNSSFYAVALQEIRVGDHIAVVPRISCQDVRITGFNQLVVEDGDLHRDGFICW